jgi:hypothetical protein
MIETMAGLVLARQLDRINEKALESLCDALQLQPLSCNPSEQ